MAVDDNRAHHLERELGGKQSDRRSPHLVTDVRRSNEMEDAASRDRKHRDRSQQASTVLDQARRNAPRVGHFRLQCEPRAAPTRMPGHTPWRQHGGACEQAYPWSAAALDRSFRQAVRSVPPARSASGNHEHREDSSFGHARGDAAQRPAERAVSSGAEHDHGDIVFVGDAQDRGGRLSGCRQGSSGEAFAARKLATALRVALGELGRDLVPVTVEAADPPDEIAAWVERQLVLGRDRDGEHDRLASRQQDAGAADRLGRLGGAVEAQQHWPAGHEAPPSDGGRPVVSEKPQSASPAIDTALAHTAVAIIATSGNVRSKKRRVAAIASAAT